MPDVKFFKPDVDWRAVQLLGEAVSAECPLETLAGHDSETSLGVMLLTSECLTGKVHGWHIDMLAIDAHDCPVSIEYDRSTNENVTRQGLFTWVGFQAWAPSMQQRISEST